MAADGDGLSDSDAEQLPETADDLRRILAMHKIDCSAWGMNGLKSVDDSCLSCVGFWFNRC